jgi:hypothetical protein
MPSANLFDPQLFEDLLKPGLSDFKGRSAGGGSALSDS